MGVPGRGQKTITINEPLYKKLMGAYESKRTELELANIRTYTAYAQKVLEKGIEQDILEGRFKVVGIFDNRVVVRDYYKVKTVEVILGREGEVYCEKDGTGDCDHVGFVLADPYVAKLAEKHGVKLRRATSPLPMEQLMKGLAEFERAHAGEEEGWSEGEFITFLADNGALAKDDAANALNLLYDEGVILKVGKRSFRRAPRRGGP